MQIVTINIPGMFLDALQRLTDDQCYPSRSEAIREALRRFLRDELEMVNALLAVKPAATVTQQAAGPRKIDMRTIRTGWSK